MLAGAPTTAERARETGSRGEGGDRTLVIDDVGRASGVRRARGAARRRPPVHRALRGAGRGRLRRQRCAGHHRPDRRLAERQARAPPPRAVDRGRGRRRRWPTSCSATCTTSGPREEWWARRGEGAWLQRRARSTRASASAAARDGQARDRSGSSRPTRAGWRRRSTGSCYAATACARSARSPSSLCQVAGARFDGMLSLRNSRGVDAAAGQLIVREAGGSSASRGFDDPLGAPLDAAAELAGDRRPDARRRCASSRGSPT